MINNHGNNGGGNPNHDENGRFTSKGNQGSGAQAEQQQINPQKVLGQMGLSQEDIAAEQERQEKIGALKEQKKAEIHKEQEGRQEALNDLGSKMDNLEGNSKNEKFAPNDYSTEFTQQEIDDFLKTIDNKTDSFPEGNPKRKKKVFVNKEEKDAFMKSLPESAEVRADEFDHTWTDENGDPDRWLTYWEVYYDEPNDKQNNSKVLDQMGLDGEDNNISDSNITEALSEQRDYFDDNATIGEVARKIANDVGSTPEKVMNILQEEAKSFGMNIDENTNYKDWWQKEEEIDPEYAPEDYSEEEDLDNQISDIETRLIDLENHAPTGLSIKEQETQKELENKLNQLKARRDGNSKVLDQMGLDDEDFGDSNGSNQISWSSLHNPTPEQEEQLNKIVNSVFPGKDWKYIIDNTDSPRNVSLGINNFLKTGNSEYLLNVLQKLKERYEYYRIKI